jgi:hypothetical protein
LAIGDRLKQAWNAFNQKDAPIESDFGNVGPTYYTSAPPDRPRLRFTGERTIISAIYTRVSIDFARLDFRHTLTDDSGRFKEEKDSNLNTCLSLEPNLDQGPSAFLQDIVLTLFDKGCCALVPVDTTKNPHTNETVDIYTLRVGIIKNWYANKVRVSVWNEDTGQRQDVVLDKRFVAIVQNPLYSVMNEPNSTHQRLIKKLSMLDVVDEQSSSGKLDLIIQLPYAVKSETRKQQADKRRDDIEMQLRGSQYGIAYADATEKVTQLNRPAENNLMGQVEFLVKMLYGQLGLTEEVMNGTASESAMINYQNRTIVPIADAVREAMQRAFIGHTGTAKSERIDYYDNPFKLVPLKDLAEIADKFSRNTIFAPNEIRGFMGFRPATDPNADQLGNRNVPPFGDPSGMAAYLSDPTQMDPYGDPAATMQDFGRPSNGQSSNGNGDPPATMADFGLTNNGQPVA